MSKFLPLWNNLRSSLWFVPGVMVTCAVVVATLLIEIDARVDPELLAKWPRLFGAGADGARGMLSAIAGSMITVAGVTFSITIVALSLASSQYTPRILRNFMGDRTNQLVLGFFVGIFAYCLVVLRTIRGGDEGRFIPSLAVAFGFVLALVGIGVLILFIHHIASSIQASSLISSAADETLRAVKNLFPKELGEGQEEKEEKQAIPEVDSWRAVPALTTGYVQSMDTKAIFSLAEKLDTVVKMERAIGEFVVEQSPLVSLATEKLLDESQIQQINDAFSISRRRTVEQDVSFGIMQLVDIALKALSPGINDTTTALTCIDYLGAVLAELAHRRIETGLPDGNQPRVTARGPTFTQLVAAAFDQIRLSAGGNVAVLSRLILSIQVMAGRTQSRARKRILLQHLHLVMNVASKTIDAAYDRGQIETEFERALVLLGEPPQSLSVSARQKGS